MKKVAVTGGVAAGKSTACQILKELGAFVINADEIVHQLLTLESAIGKKVVALLGHDIVEHGTIQRKKIADIVFQNHHPLLKSLEEILHPEVQKVIDLSYNELVKNGSSFSLYVVELPLVFEAHLENYYDITLFIQSDPLKRRERFIKKGFTDSSFDRRQSRLFPEEDKIQKSSYVIENNRTYEDFKISLSKLYRLLIKET